jgi:hypothetical protein
MRRVAGVAVFALSLVIVAAAPAAACGGLVGENGTIQLTRTSTLAAWHDGIERYVTSFEFTGSGEEVGSIVPLPAVPTKVERGGDWTLQRLEQEVPPPPTPAGVLNDAGAKLQSTAEVLQQTKIDALDITILRGGGDAVGKWAIDHGFLLTPDAPAVLDFYSQRSQVFMAARFDARRAEDLGQNAGDGTPIMLTIPTPQPWVPLRILALGLDRTQVVDADVFLLTDERPNVFAADPGVNVVFTRSASSGLLDDLRSDKHMGWVPEGMWLSYVSVALPAAELRHDLAVSTADALPSARLAGFVTDEPGDSDTPWLVSVLVLALPVLLVGGGAHVLARRSRP